MSLLVTQSPNGKRRYYIDGRRVTRDAMDRAAFWKPMECSHTVIRNGFIRHYSEAR